MLSIYTQTWPCNGQDERIVSTSANSAKSEAELPIRFFAEVSPVKVWHTRLWVKWRDFNRLLQRKPRKATDTAEAEMSTGPEQLGKNIIKSCAKAATKSIHLFKRLTNDIYPQPGKSHGWHRFTKVCVTEVNKYKPSSVSFCISKMFENIINNKVYETFRDMLHAHQIELDRTHRQIYSFSSI